MSETRTEYALQHKTSRRYQTARPSAGYYGESPHEAEAWSSPFMSIAELEHFELGAFAPCWVVAPIIRPIPTTLEDLA